MDAIDMYYQFGLERLKSQEALNREYGNKAANILAFSLALVAAAAVVINLPGNDTERSVQFWIPLGGLGTIFVFVVVSSIFVLRPRDWYYGPQEADFPKYIDVFDASIIQRWVSDSYRQSVECNKNQLRQKERWLQTALIGVLFETIALVFVGVSCCWP